MVVSISEIMTSKATKNTSTMLDHVLKRGHSGGCKSYVVVLRLLYFYSLEESQCTEYTLFNHSTIILLSSKGLGKRK